MNEAENYIAINKETWNKKTEIHLASSFYNNDEFIKGVNSLNELDLNLLGDISGKTILHLQCHFGQDSISLSRLGATVVGVDLADKAIESAQQLAKETNANTKFICCDIYDLPQHLDQKFDIVFTSYGTIGWLPDLDKWAKLVSHFLKPQGQFVFVEFHPFVWMFDDNFENIIYKYFTSDPIIETEQGTYADRDSNISTSSITWNHSLSEVISSLINNGLTIKSFEEYDYSPYDCFNNTIQVEEGKYRIKNLDDKIPMLYSIKAEKV